MRRAFFLAAVLTLATADWKLVFEENFDGTSPSINTSKWDFEIGYIRNNELQWYDNSSTNVNITDGSLLITATNQTQSLPNGVVPYCRSGSIYSIESFIYGRFEMRAKLPGRQGNGTWPAFWLLGADVDTTGWPMCGEIDIMENVGFDRNTLFTTLHDAQNSSERNNDISNHVQVPTMYTEFNVYSVEWRPNFIEFFVNNQSVLRYDNDNRCRSTSWPWFKPFQIKVNLAIGGAWGGSHGVDESIFPAQYAVDYIRVYQETEDKVPNCDLAFAYILFETSVETSMLRWMVMATGNHLVQLHNAVEEDISRLAGVNSSSVHTWAVIVRDKDGRGQLCLNVSLLNWSENIRDWFFAQALSSAAWATTLQSALSNALPSDPTLSPLYAGSEYPFGTDRVAFKPRRLHVAEVLHIPAWEYDFGGPSVAFHDTTPWNQCGNFGRAPPDTVDVGAGEGGNFAVGYIRPTEFLHFSEISIVNSSSLGAHALLRIKARYASVSDADSSCQVEIVTATGGLLVTSLNFSNTGSWEAFTDSLWSDVRVPADVLSSFGIALRFHDPSPFNIQSLHLLVASI